MFTMRWTLLIADSHQFDKERDSILSVLNQSETRLTCKIFRNFAGGRGVL